MADVAGSGRHARAHRLALPVVPAGIAVVLAATGFRAWAQHGTWFFFDDFFFLQVALDHGLTPAYLLKPYNGHLMPASTLLCWVNAQVSPLDHRLPAAEMLVLFALFGLATLRLLVTLFGRRRAVLVPLVLLLFSPALLPVTTWWAAGVNQLPMLLATVLALDAFVRHLRAGRTRDLVASVLWLLLGLAFVERTVLALPMLWLVALMYFATGTVPERLRDLWRHHRRAVVSHALLLGTYLAAYVPWALNFDARTVTSRPLFAVVRELVGTAFGSAVVGGPLGWRVSDVTQSEAHPTQGLLVLGWAVLAALVVASARGRRRGLRAWLLPLVMLAADAALVATSRAIYFGPRIALDYRFQTEAALALALAIGLAFLPVRGAVESSEPVPRTWQPGAPTVVACLAVFVALASVSTARFPLRSLTTTSPRAYYANVEASARAHPGAQLLDLPTPPWLWAPLAYPTNTYSHMFRALAPPLRIRTVTTDRAYLVDDRGHLRAVEFHPVRHQVGRRQGAGDRCVGHAWAGSSRWRLDGPVVGVGWFLRLSYDAPAATEMRVTISGVARSLRLRPGPHVALLPATGTYDHVDLALPKRAEPVCLRSLQVGTISPAAR